MQMWAGVSPVPAQMWHSGYVGDLRAASASLCIAQPPARCNSLQPIRSGGALPMPGRFYVVAGAHLMLRLLLIDADHQLHRALPCRVG